MVKHSYCFVLILLTCVAAFANLPFQVQAPHPNFVTPQAPDITGVSCTENVITEFGMATQDQTNLYWTGKVYSQVNGCKSGLIYEGCAVVQWDPTGTTYTIQQVIYRHETDGLQRTRKVGAYDCLTEKAVG